MSTRLRRPAFWRPLGVTVVLVAFQAYLGYSAISGQFGIESRKDMLADMERLQAQSSVLQAEIDSYKHRASLFDPARLDPDILTEQARMLLGMAHPDDIVVMVDDTGKPIGGSSFQLTERKVNTKIEAGID
jgi:cell division protein FtsB